MVFLQAILLLALIVTVHSEGDCSSYKSEVTAGRSNMEREYSQGDLNINIRSYRVSGSSGDYYAARIVETDKSGKSTVFECKYGMNDELKWQDFLVLSDKLLLVTFDHVMFKKRIK